MKMISTKMGASTITGAAACFALMAMAGSNAAIAAPPAVCATAPSAPQHHNITASADTVNWGYFSKDSKPRLTVHSGDMVTIETLTHHANDDADRMVKGDPGAESVFGWTKDKKNVERRGAGPMDASILGRGAGEGFGVHILTGPIYVCDAEPGDVLEVRILDVTPRPSGNPKYKGKSFGSNVAAWWGYLSPCFSGIKATCDL